MIKKKTKLQEQVDRILFISNYNLINPPKVIKESYGDEKEIKYEDVEKEQENGYPSNYQYLDEYLIEQGPKKKPLPPKSPELIPKPEGGTPPVSGPTDSMPPLPTGDVPGEQTPPVDTTPSLTPEQPPEETKPEVKMATKTDVKGVSKEVSSVEDYSKKVMTQQAEILTKVDDLINKLGNVDQLSQKVDQIGQGLKEIKPQSYKEKLDLQSLKSFPYNIKLSDYWGTDDQEQKEPEQKEYKLDKQDIVNFDQREIKDSLFSTGEEDEDQGITNRRKTGY